MQRNNLVAPEPVVRHTPDDATIRTLYVERRFSDQEIADALGCHRTTVTRRRLALGITRADRQPAQVVA